MAGAVVRFYRICMVILTWIPVRIKRKITRGIRFVRLWGLAQAG